MSATGLKISVPCGSCTESITFGQRVCASCGAAVSSDARRALDQRLEAADPDFRTLKSNIRTASMILLVVAIAHLLFGLATYFVTIVGDLLPPTAAELEAARIELISNLFVSVTMVACFVWARRTPTPALTTALVVWVAVQATTALAGGLALSTLRIFVVKLVIFAMLVRGIVSAVTAASLRRKLAPPRPAPLPSARVVGQR